MVVIPVPIGVEFTATASGLALKVLECEHCRTRFGFTLRLEAEGTETDVLFLDRAGSAEQAQAKANANLRTKQQQIVVPVPCPTCGRYQQDMAQKLKDDASINKVQIVGGMITLASMIPLLFMQQLAWTVAAAIFSVGIAVLLWGYIIAFRYDPNGGDPEPRIQLGRKLTARGQRLERMLAERSGLVTDARS